MIGKLLCWLGRHKPHQEPFHRELLKDEGSFILWSFAVQKGITKCAREGCQVEIKVYRSGICGSGGDASPWRELSEELEAYIDRLPVL